MTVISADLQGIYSNVLSVAGREKTFIVQQPAHKDRLKKTHAEVFAAAPLELIHLKHSLGFAAFNNSTFVHFSKCGESVLVPSRQTDQPLHICKVRIVSSYFLHNPRESLPSLMFPQQNKQTLAH